jgi:hypothetical protein
MDHKSLQAVYATEANVEAQLLFEGVKLLKSGVSDLEALRLLSQIKVDSVDSHGMIYFTLGDQVYKVYRGADGKAVLEHASDLSSATITESQPEPVIDPVPEPQPPVVVVEDPVAPVGEPVESIDLTKIQAALPEHVDAQLLLAGMKLLKPEASEQEVVALMSQIHVAGADATGGVLFTFEDQGYRVYHNANGAVALDRLDDALLMPVDPYQVKPLSSSSVSEEENAEEAAASLAAARLMRMNYSFQRTGKGRRTFSSSSSLRSISSALHDSLYLSAGQGSGTTALFGFEKGNLLFSKILTELTR